MPEMPVRYAMRSDIITASQGETLNKVARLMTQWNVALVIVTDGEKPLGLVTEKDILGQVVAEDLKPSKVKVEDVMVSPIIMISNRNPQSRLSRIFWVNNHAQNARMSFQIMPIFQLIHKPD